MTEKATRLIYEFPNATITDLVVTDSREETIRLIERGYTLFTVPQMFESETGVFVLYYR